MADPDCEIDVVSMYAPLVRRLCHEDLAGLIYKHIGWKSDKPRARSDWNFAGEILAADDNFHLQLREYTARFLLNAAVNELEAQGAEVPDIISSDKIMQLVGSLDYKKQRKYEEEILGGDIWEFFWDHKSLPIFWIGNYTGFHDRK
jgi:hypothetical protein